MLVFKNYFKIVKNYKGMIIMYTAIFAFFAIMLTTFNSVKNVFEPSKPNIVIINDDQETTFIQSFKDYIKDNAKIVNVKINKDDLADALFYHEADLIITIPKNFTSNFLKGLNPSIAMERVPDSYDSTYAIMLLNRYLNVAAVYTHTNLIQEKINELIKKDLKNTSEVIMINKDKTSNISNANYFYNFTNYSVLAVCIFIIALVMNSFRNQNIRKRNIISPLSYKKINRQLFLGNLCLSLGTWALYVIISFILYGTSVISPIGLLLNFNLLLFALFACSVGFLIGSLVNSREAISGMVNVIALGTSFICGAFVPQELLGSTVLQFARILPSYWFIKTNNMITILSSFNLDNLKPIFRNMSIIVIYTIIILLLTNFIAKNKLKHK